MIFGNFQVALGQLISVNTVACRQFLITQSSQACGVGHPSTMITISNFMGFLISEYHYTFIV